MKEACSVNGYIIFFYVLKIFVAKMDCINNIIEALFLIH